MLIGIGNSIGVHKGSHVNLWTPEYRAIYDSWSIKPDSKIIRAQQIFVKTLTESGIWSKLSCIIPVGAGVPASSDALKWWNNPAKSGTLSATPPRYDFRNGFEGDGSSAYIDTGFNPVIDGGSLFTRNNCSWGVSVMNERRVDKGWSCGQYQSGLSNYIQLYTGGPGVTTSCNSGENTTTVSGHNLPNFIIINRSESTNYKVTTDISNYTVTKNTSGLLNLNFTILGTRTSSSSVVEMGMDAFDLFFAGSALTDEEVTTIRLSWRKLKRDIFYQYNAGVCLSFDDRSGVPGWASADSVFSTYGWKATFAIDAKNEAELIANANNINYLKSHGHEIANHTVNHPDYIDYINAYGIQAYYDNEIAPLQTMFNNVFGWVPETFCYAQRSGESYEASRLIFDSGFNHIRSFTLTVPDVKSISVKMGWRTVYAIDIGAYRNDIESVLTMLQLAKDNNMIVSIFGHSIGAEGQSSTSYIISRDYLHQVFQFMNNIGLKFYRINELPVGFK